MTFLVVYSKPSKKTKFRQLRIRRYDGVEHTALSEKFRVFNVFMRSRNTKFLALRYALHGSISCDESIFELNFEKLNIAKFHCSVFPNLRCTSLIILLSDLQARLF
jgi:hypothetical protein